MGWVESKRWVDFFNPNSQSVEWATPWSKTSENFLLCNNTNVTRDTLQVTANQHRIRCDDGLFNGLLLRNKPTHMTNLCRQELLNEHEMAENIVQFRIPLLSQFDLRWHWRKLLMI